VGKGLAGVQLGTRSVLDDATASMRVYRSGRSARMDERDWASIGDGALRDAGRRSELVSSVASPITVGDRLWGTISISAAEQLPSGTEARLERFGELLGIAIASTEAQEALR